MKTFVICLIAMLVAIPAWGQWEYGGKQIGYGPIGAIGLQPRLCPDDRGGVYVVWTAYFEDRPGREIVLCHFDTSGIELFGTNGLLITNDSLDQSMPAISPDGFGGCYVVWTDHRDFPDRQHGSLYAQRVTYGGEMLWGQGVRLFYTPGYAPDDSPLRGTDLCSDTSFGLVAVCKLDTGYQKSILISQRLDEDGNRLWDSLGVVIHSGSGVWLSNFIQPHLITSASNLFCAWLCRISYDTVGIYMQKFDLNANINFGQTGLSVITDGNPSVGIGNDQDDRGIQIIPDSFGGVIIGWVYDNLSLGSTLKADRISPSGQSLWQMNGKMLIPMERSWRTALGLHQIGEGNSSRFLAVVFEGYQANYQIVDLAGNLILGDTGGILESNQFFASAECADTLYFMKKLGNYYFASKKDVSANEYWPNIPYIHGWMEDYEIMADRLGGMYVAFTLYKDFRTDWVYIQRIYADGHFGGDTTAIDEFESPILPNSPFNLTNYPNPFNSSTLISFDVSMPSPGSIRIFDALGRMVDSMEFGQLNAGNHSYLWDIEGKGLKLSSGSYIISLKIGSRTETRRIMILK